MRNNETFLNYLIFSNYQKKENKKMNIYSKVKKIIIILLLILIIFSSVISTNAKSENENNNYYSVTCKKIFSGWNKISNFKKKNICKIWILVNKFSTSTISLNLHNSKFTITINACINFELCNNDYLGNRPNTNNLKTNCPKLNHLTFPISKRFKVCNVLKSIRDFTKIKNFTIWEDGSLRFIFMVKNN